MPWDHVERRPAKAPFAIADGRKLCLVLGWERGHGDMPRTWQARVLYMDANGPMETLIPASRIKAAGADDPAVKLYVEHFAPKE